MKAAIVCATATDLVRDKVSCFKLSQAFGKEFSFSSLWKKKIELANRLVSVSVCDFDGKE